jgi:hypothetical protein
VKSRYTRYLPGLSFTAVFRKKSVLLADSKLKGIPNLQWKRFVLPPSSRRSLAYVGDASECWIGLQEKWLQWFGATVTTLMDSL